MANRQAVVGVRNPITGRMTHTIWNPGDTLVDPDGNPIGDSLWTESGGHLYPAAGATEKVSVGTTTAPSASGGPSDVGAHFRVETGHIEIQGANAGAFDGPHFVMGTYHIWIDASGNLRIKNGIPATHDDGTVIGMQNV